LTSRLLLLAALIAVLFTILRMNREDSTSPRPAVPVSQETGYYLRDALMTDYGADGHVKLQMAARMATEDPATEKVAMQDVSVLYFVEPEQSWRLTALRGDAQPGTHTVELEGDVVMSGERPALSQPAVVHTERLTLDTETQQAYTAAPVTLDVGSNGVTAIGMRADLKAETLRLESSVNGRFTP